MSESGKPKVVILGGGVGAITAAFELSRAGWRDRYESITVYQLGWRLGGKGASGRGDHGRIEEHGLHVWLGFYENAFRMMRQCFDELSSVHPPDDQDWSHLASIDSAFMRASVIVGEERRPGGWVPWVIPFPENDEEPGTTQSTADLPQAWQYVVQSVRLAATFLESAVRRATPPHAQPADVRLRDAAPAMGAEVTGGLVLRQASAHAIGRAWRSVTAGFWRAEKDTARLTHVILAAVLALLDDLDSQSEEHAAAGHDRLARLLGELARAAQAHVKADVEASDDARREWYLADILLACARGIIGHGLLHHPDGFDAIDEFDFADWLVLNGADPESARCTIVRTAGYDLPFAYSEGEPGKAAVSAGTALRGMCRLFFTYKGAISWKMRAGMGDIVFAPLYLVLRERGVDFQFFQRATRVRVAADDPHLVEAIEFDRQVPEEVAAAYDPLVTVNGRPCWPARPDVDIDVEALAALEESVVDVPANPWTLEVGVADKVVLGISLGVLRTICADMIGDHPEWRWMVDKVETVATQAFQLWLGESFGELGAAGAPTEPDDVAESLRFLTSGGYVEPFDTWADMSHLIPMEGWPAGQGPRAIAYLCNALAGVDPETRHDQRYWNEVVKGNAERFLRRHALHLWPGSVARYPDEFRWDLLVDPAGGEGHDRFDAQYFRANVDPSERYVLSVPGSGRSRLWPDESGYENLFLAGDWTRCGLDFGCVESAVMSGMLAAAAVEGTADVDHVVGAKHL